MLTVLVQDVQALLDEQRRVEDDQAVADRQDVVARPGLEKGANGALARRQPCRGCAASIHSLPGRQAARGPERFSEGGLVAIARANSGVLQMQGAHR